LYIIFTTCTTAAYKSFISWRVFFFNYPKFKCRNSNNVYFSTSLTKALPVFPRPTIPSLHTVNETDEVEYACIAVGLPAPSFNWSTPQQPDLSTQSNVRITSTGTQSDGATRIRSVLRFESILQTLIYFSMLTVGVPSCYVPLSFHTQY